MEEMKFMVRDLLKNKWVQDVVLLPNGKLLEHQQNDDGAFHLLELKQSEKRYKKHPYSGLNDIHKNEIYAGHLVKGNSNHQIGEVVITNASFHVEWNNGTSDLLSDITNYCEVIGNVYENRSLLLELNKAEIGNRIKNIRTTGQWNLEEFGLLVLNASKGTVSNWENGVYVPSKQRLERIALIGHTTVNWLLYGSELSSSDTL